VTNKYLSAILDMEDYYYSKSKLSKEDMPIIKMAVFYIERLAVMWYTFFRSFNWMKKTNFVKAL